MAFGPGVYDAFATFVREDNAAEGVVLIVAGGKSGNGFSVQTTNAAFLRALPAMLRDVAGQIEADVNNQGGGHAPH